jgi:phosphomannomutase
MTNLNIDQKILQTINEWLNANIDKETKAEIKDLLEKDHNKLKEAFYKKLTFGTGGIRALVGVGTNQLNQYTIQMATQGLSNYISKQHFENPSVVIGFDSRSHSRFFAEETAKVLSANNIKVYFVKELRATPFISFACRALKCSAAVMITASHNPPEYNGYKVYWSDGGQILPPHDIGIIYEYQKITSFDQLKIGPFNTQNIEFVSDEMDEMYLTEMLKNISNKDEILKNGPKLKIVYTNLHGVGITLAPKAFQKLNFTSFETVKKQESIDGSFPFAKIPNPEDPKALSLGINQLVENDADILIANDPDADRMAAAINIQKTALILSGNQIACILAYYICEELLKQDKIDKNFVFIKSIVTSDLFKDIVESYQMKCLDVLTGFKYIAEKIRDFETDSSHTFIFGAEESYGYLKGTYCRDKDGILAACLLSEVALKQKLQNKTLLDLLHEIYLKFGIHREGQKSLHFEESSENSQKIDLIMKKLRDIPPRFIAESEIQKIDDYLIQKSTDLVSGACQEIKLPKANVLAFTLKDYTKIIIRPSGTEPKIKIYVKVKEKNPKNILEDISKTDTRLNNYLTAFVNEIA